MIEKKGYVYILTNVSNRVLYTGVTSDLVKRVYQHRNKAVEGFTEKYNVSKLIYYEVFEDMITALMREKQIKGWKREKKIALIEKMNPKWKDLSAYAEDHGLCPWMNARRSSASARCSPIGKALRDTRRIIPAKLQHVSIGAKQNLIGTTGFARGAPYKTIV